MITSSPDAYWKEGTVTEVTGETADVTVNDGSTAQDWAGFGGTFNEKGWEALAALDPEDRDRAIKLLFDAADGAKFIYGRIPIGASDYATSRHTLNDKANDTSMESFSIARDREKLIPFIKAAMAVNPDIHFWGSPWTPPPWMKDNNAYDRGNMKDNAANLDAYALYFARFVEEYGKEGITIEAVHPQNEPGFPQDYPSCLWTGALMAKFIGSHLGPTFEERGIRADIFVGTMSNTQTDGDIVTTVMDNAAARSYVKGYGFQWGMLDTFTGLRLDKGLAIWQTEHKCGNYPWQSGTDQSKAPNDHAYAVESWGLIRDWIKKGVNAYSAWNMVLDTVGRSLDTVRPWAQNALLAVDVPGKKLNITPAYYVFRHVSQYVDPGAKVVATSGGDALAFKNPDGTLVAVMYNAGAAKQAVVAVGGKKLQFELPARGWATINWK
ncbi:glycoside hydrolase family 30 protein [Sorangium sp. So ce362]|uniref:glycoside hydrolase family 30 protein n=1 Tax=Sorangium sp. So ce362 TaxID=3133303 RepID=UPI003F61B13A